MSKKSKKNKSFASQVIDAAVFGIKPSKSSKVDTDLAAIATVLKTPLGAHVRNVKTGKVQCTQCNGVSRFTELCSEGQEAVLIGRQIYGYSDTISGGPKPTSLF